MEARLEKPLLVAALLTIPLIIIGESHPHDTWKAVYTALNWGIWLAFAAELVLMLAVVPNRWHWIRTHPLEVAVVLLTPPVLPRSLHAARVLRVLRVLRILRLGVNVRRMLSEDALRASAVLMLMTILGGGAAYAAVEKGQHLGVWDGVWWAIQTVTTLGYGDSVPTTAGGKVITVAVLVVGITFVAIFTAAMADRFLRNDAADPQHAEVISRLDDIARRLDALERRS